MQDFVVKHAAAIPPTEFEKQVSECMVICTIYLWNKWHSSHIFGVTHVLSPPQAHAFAQLVGWPTAAPSAQDALSFTRAFANVLLSQIRQ